MHQIQLVFLIRDQHIAKAAHGADTGFAHFVAQKLAPIEHVMSTATHFVLRKYKDKGVVYGVAPEVDERENCN